jgi:uncharacterized protein (DUF885 family)
MRRLIAGSAALALVFSAAARAQPSPYGAIEASYFEGEWAASPTAATGAGRHDRDSLLDDVSAPAQAAQSARLKRILQRLQAVDPKGLSSIERDDRDILIARIGGELLQLDTIQGWRHDPSTYVNLTTASIYSLIERDFAPAPERMRDVIAREKAVPALLAAGQKNLSDMPAVFIDIALENLDGTPSFLAQDVPSAFADVSDPALKAELAASTQAALAAVAEYRAFLIAQRPGARADFALGRETLQRLLAADMVTIPVDQVMAAGRAQLAKDQAAFLATQKQVDPADPSGALALIGRDHPDGAHLISTAQDQLASLRAFIEARHILDLPSPLMPTAAETPVFSRAVIFGELDAPGPLETHATKAYYFITPPDTKDTPARQQAFLEYLNRPILQNLAVHEVLPGHFVQYLFQRANPGWSLTRAMAGSYTATEGWAHYTEQMMLDEGLGGGDPRLRLAQLQDALLRDCRLVASLGMHTREMTLEQATTMMAEQCFQPANVAIKEARRGTSDPGYFSYTLGKLEILKLREDVRAKEGAAFSLARFHDRFLNAGLIPIAMIRREILGADGPVL